jgi:hypothetical protein
MRQVAELFGLDDRAAGEQKAAVLQSSKSNEMLKAF